MHARQRPLLLLALVVALAGCTRAIPPAPVATPTATSVPTDPINLDAETIRAIDGAARVAFVIPFSHWDTNWHDTYDSYSDQADRNILTAMVIAQRYPRFRYTLEQVVFVQHFWEHHPEQREVLRALVRSRQFTFASGGLTQQDTSLTAPAVQWRNWQLGQTWLRDTFGIEARTAWQADSFGNAAGLPIMLGQQGLGHLYLGRIGTICEQRPCDNPLPHAFRWQSPADPNQSVLATYITYSATWQALRDKPNEEERRAALRALIDREAARTTSKYLFLPFSDDFANQSDDLPGFVERWNAAEPGTLLVQADPETAFRYLDTQALPRIVADRNPLWQGFYGSRPYGKIADKESEYYLSAAGKFGIPLGEAAPGGWNLAAFNTAHDGIAGTGFDSVWDGSQRPSFTQAVADGAASLTERVGRITGGIDAPVVVFNPTSWARSEVIELRGDLPDLAALPAPVQVLGPNHVAFLAEAVPALGWRGFAGGTATVAHPATVAQAGARVTLANGLVSATIDGERGGTIASLRAGDGPELLAGPGDDLVYLEDRGDVYGASFGAERARQSQTPAQITVLASGPLISRVAIATTVGGQVVTKILTLRADSPQIEIEAQLTAPADTTALVQMPTTRATTTRTDDVGFATYAHPLDNRPITPGTSTYRRVVFYPVTAWGDVSADGAGLTLITHGLQGLAGTDTLGLMLLRQVSDGGGPGAEGVADNDPHIFRYAYLPHAGGATEAAPWLAAYAFNQPLIAAWSIGARRLVQLPFDTSATPRAVPADTAPARAFPRDFSLVAATSGIVADASCQGGQAVALLIDYDPASPVEIDVPGTARQTLPTVGVAQRTLPLADNPCRAAP